MNGYKLNPNRLLSFGVLTDVQYADRDDQKAWYSPEKMRYYRTSLDHVKAAFENWIKGDVSFVLQLGDLIDASNRTLNLDASKALKKVLDIFNQYPIPSYHVLGNHEVDSVSRNQLVSYNYIGKGERQYYSFSPAEKLTIIAIDCLEISILGYPETHPNYKKAFEILKHYHISEDMTLWEYDENLKGSDKRFVSYNGALSQLQLEWLQEQLVKADENHHKVIICGHLSLFSESSHWTCVCWNWSEVLKIMHSHNSVVAYFCGHYHETGYAKDSHGIHHVTMGGIIEVPPEELSYSTVHVFNDRLEIAGSGREKSYVLPFTSYTN